MNAPAYPHVSLDDPYAALVVSRMERVLRLGGKLPPERFERHDCAHSVSNCWHVIDGRGRRRVALESDFRAMDGWAFDALCNLIGEDAAYAFAQS